MSFSQNRNYQNLRCPVADIKIETPHTANYLKLKLNKTTPRYCLEIPNFIWRKITPSAKISESTDEKQKPPNSLKNQALKILAAENQKRTLGNLKKFEYGERIRSVSQDGASGARKSKFTFGFDVNQRFNFQRPRQRGTETLFIRNLQNRSSQNLRNGSGKLINTEYLNHLNQSTPTQNEIVHESKISPIKRIKANDLEKTQLSVTLQHHISINYSYFRPFSRICIMKFNLANITNSFCLGHKLRNFRAFFGGIFFFEKISSQTIQDLSELEIGMISKIFKEKNYKNNSTLIEALSFPHRLHSKEAFYHITRNKRKEERLKYAFRLLLKGFQEEFDLSVLKNLNGFSNLTLRQREVLLYCFFFRCQSDLNIFKKFYACFLKNPDIRAGATRSVEKFIFPDIQNKTRLSYFKSFNKQFFKVISQSKPFVHKMNRSLLTLVFYLGNSGFIQSQPPYLRDVRLCGANLKRRILFSIIDHNTKELAKLVSEWENIIQRRFEAPSFQYSNQNPPSDADLLELLGRNIQKPNFKFPWSIKEIQIAFADTFFSLNEFSETSNRAKNLNRNFIFFMRLQNLQNPNDFIPKYIYF